LTLSVRGPDEWRGMRMVADEDLAEGDLYA
jgi:hypothetical protein